jgi:hypothetical protein
LLFTVSTTFSDSQLPLLDGSERVICVIPHLPLAPGRYYMSLYGGPLYHAEADSIDRAIDITVIESDYYGNGRIPNAHWGALVMRSKWHILS